MVQDRVLVDSLQHSRFLASFFIFVLSMKIKYILIVKTLRLITLPLQGIVQKLDRSLPYSQCMIFRQIALETGVHEHLGLGVGFQGLHEGVFGNGGTGLVLAGWFVLEELV